MFNTWFALGQFSSSLYLTKYYNIFSQTVDSLATAVLSYLVAVPLTLMVEMPIVRVANTLIAKPAAKEVKS